MLAGGTLFGSSYGRGSAGWGTLIAIGTNGTGFTNLHNFHLIVGQSPWAELTLSGNRLYGATPTGGTNSNGTLFALNTDGTGFTNLYAFGYSPAYPYTNDDGATPLGSLGLSGGLLYGTTASGGTNATGTIFRIQTNGTGFTVLHQFSNLAGTLQTNADGANPQSGLFLFSNALNGTTLNGGNAGNGTIFRLNTDGSGFTTLYQFTATNTVTGTNTDGAHPVGGLVFSGGAVYGTTTVGGTDGNGTLYSLQIPPPLFITKAGTNVILSWPTNFTGFTLQSATNLAPPIKWTSLASQYAATNPITNIQGYFRLMHP